MQQSINGNASQLAQHVLLGSNFNAIANGMNLTVGYDPQADARRISAEGAMSAMKSFGM